MHKIFHHNILKFISASLLSILSSYVALKHFLYEMIANLDGLISKHVMLYFHKELCVRYVILHKQ